MVTKEFKGHLSVLDRVLRRLLAAGLTVSRDKCYFVKSKWKYLEYVVDPNGLHTDPDKVKCMFNYPTPQKCSECTVVVPPIYLDFCFAKVCLGPAYSTKQVYLL